MSALRPKRQHSLFEILTRDFLRLTEISKENSEEGSLETLNNRLDHGFRLGGEELLGMLFGGNQEVE